MRFNRLCDCWSIALRCVSRSLPDLRSVQLYGGCAIGTHPTTRVRLCGEELESRCVPAGGLYLWFPLVPRNYQWTFENGDGTTNWKKFNPNAGLLDKEW